MVIRYFQKALLKFMQYQASSGILLIIMTLLAIIFANSELASLYHKFLEMPFVLKLGSFEISKNFELFVNDGLMALFFFLVSLEIKREVMEGQLSTRDQQILPVVGAIGGILIPALFYVVLNHDNILPTGENAMNGWAIPTATDIAFALGILSLFGSRVPTSLKAFLTALAIIDDLAAILIIAIFYSDNIVVNNLLLGAIIMIFLCLLNKFNVKSKTPYFVLGFILWALVLKSGVHATVAGVLLGLTIPLYHHKSTPYSPLKSIEHGLEPWVAFFILPLFAFCNAGIDLSGFNMDNLFNNMVPLGIMTGLFLGKQLGVFALIYFAIKKGYASMLNGANWAQIYGVSVLTGIGFTMSIFIGNLAFTDNPALLNDIRIGILAGSVLSAILGYVILHFSCPKARIYHAPQKKKKSK